MAPDDAQNRPNPLLKLALELGPLILFFVAYRVWDIYVATGAFMVAITVSLAVTRVREKRWPPMPLVSAVLVLVLGGLTIWMQDDTFIKVKLTVVNALFGLTLLVGVLLGRHLLKHLLGEAVHLADAGWRALTSMWITYFFGVAAVNEVVWRNTTTDTWVNFKVIALPVLTLVFVFAQAPVIAKHDLSERAEGSGPGG